METNPERELDKVRDRIRGRIMETNLKRELEIRFKKEKN